MAGKKQTATKKKGAGGRPSKISPEICKTVCENIELGMPYKHAAEAAGISYNTFLGWRAKGEAAKADKSPSKYNANEKLYVEFLEATIRAEADGVKTNLELIRRAAIGGDDFRPDWRAAAFVLKNRHPEDFTETQKIDQKTEHSGNMGVTLNVVDMSKKKDQ